MSLSSKARAFLKTALGDNTANNEIKGLLNMLSGAPTSVTYTIGDESGNARTITAQLKDAAGNVLTERATVEVHVCSDSTGTTLATGGSTGIAASTNTYLAAILAKKVFTVTSSATGLITLTWTDTGTEAVYLVTVFPNGKRSVSAVIANA